MNGLLEHFKINEWKSHKTIVVGLNHLPNNLMNRDFTESCKFQDNVQKTCTVPNYLHHSDYVQQSLELEYYGVVFGGTIYILNDILAAETCQLYRGKLCYWMILNPSSSAT